MIVPLRKENSDCKRTRGDESSIPGTQSPYLLEPTHVEDTTLVLARYATNLYARESIPDTTTCLALEL